jgi:hypothetical protein
MLTVSLPIAELAPRTVRSKYHKSFVKCSLTRDLSKFSRGLTAGARWVKSLRQLRWPSCRICLNINQSSGEIPFVIIIAHIYSSQSEHVPPNISGKVLGDLPTFCDTVHFERRELLLSLASLSCFSLDLFMKDAYKSYFKMSRCNSPIIRRNCVFNTAVRSKTLGACAESSLRVFRKRCGRVSAINLGGSQSLENNLAGLMRDLGSPF